MNIQGHMGPFLDIPNPKPKIFLTPRHSLLSTSQQVPTFKQSPKHGHKLNRKGGCIEGHQIIWPELAFHPHLLILLVD